MKKELLHASKKVNAETKKYLTRHKAAALGSAAILAFIGADRLNWEMNSKSGEVETYQPSQPEHVTIDNHFNLITWNLNNETFLRYKEIEDIAEENDSDAGVLQEVNASDAGRLPDNIKGWYFTYGWADGRAHAEDGGFGNVIMTRQKPRDIDSRSISGTGYIDSRLRWAENKLVPLANAIPTVDINKERSQSYREALALSIDAQNGNEIIENRIITSHILGKEITDTNQLEELGDFIKDNLKEGRSTYFCGDLNILPDRIIPWFNKMGFYVLKTGNTWVKSSWVIDYCAYNPNGLDKSLELQNVSVLKDHSTDHYPIVAKWLYEMPNELALHYPQPPNKELVEREERMLHLRPHSGSDVNTFNSNFQDRH